jgi:hypothetical protein
VHNGGGSTREPKKKQVYLPIKTLGDLTRANTDGPVVPLAPPAVCSACGGSLVMSGEFHARGLWWAYASCPAPSQVRQQAGPSIDGQHTLAYNPA